MPTKIYINKSSFALEVSSIGSDTSFSRFLSTFFGEAIKNVTAPIKSDARIVLMVFVFDIFCYKTNN